MEGWATYTELYSYNFSKGKYSDEALRFLRLNDEVNGLIQTRLDKELNSIITEQKYKIKRLFFNI